jgi:hypothetical protein
MFTIPPISIKSTITSHLNSLNKKGGTTTYDVRNPGPGLGQAQKYCGLNWLHIIHLYIYSGTCLIQHTNGPGKCVGLYRMSEYSGFNLVNRNTLGP